ncbi:winged helix DNA-binding domain-containing protein [Yinghuangia seranimata]|uniref:winged helix DNA-binding domain-containing protein n=1 Tax=Yinghuangia seranimata TaxID=408067 RepID=UPI00248C5EFF|nr:winged helix DNA-binding domain-containing protein [Yinghuangia seranimata]MDI2129582.1 winged helix DNA-binding domain-containing protein [Yinghuangia seranimata]
MTEHAAEVRLLRARAQAVAGHVREGTAAGVVRRVFAVQAQDAQAAALGIRARGRDLTAEQVRAAYEDDRSVVTAWFMRGTLHTVPAEDARWLIALLGPRLVAGAARRQRELGLTADLLERATATVVDALTAEGPLGRADLTERLARVGVDPEGQAAFHVIRHAAVQGLVCAGPRRDGAGTYVLTADWLPPDEGPRGDAAAAELAVRYARAHGPAEAEDFAHWSGLPAGTARKAWAAAGSSAAAPHKRVSDTATGTGRTPDVRLLPAYDGYFLAYRSREFAVPQEFERRVWPGGGVLRAAVVADGRAIGTWTRAKGVEFTPFGPPWPDAVGAAADAESAAVARFLGS